MAEDSNKKEKTIFEEFAHEFNNVLAVIINEIEFALVNYDDKDKVIAKLHEAEGACMHAKELVEHLVNFNEEGALSKLPYSVKKDMVRVPVIIDAGKGGNVLLVEDEELLLATISDFLRNWGYDVTAVDNGPDAIEKFREQKYDVVILDLTIRGGIGAVEILEELKKLDIHVKAIVSSGYTNDPVMLNYADHGFTEALSKPYRIDKLVDILSGILED